MLLSAV